MKINLYTSDLKQWLSIKNMAHGLSMNLSSRLVSRLKTLFCKRVNTLLQRHQNKK